MGVNEIRVFCSLAPSLFLIPLSTACSFPPGLRSVHVVGLCKCPLNYSRLVRGEGKQGSEEGLEPRAPLKREQGTRSLRYPNSLDERSKRFKAQRLDSEIRCVCRDLSWHTYIFRATKEISLYAFAYYIPHVAADFELGIRIEMDVGGVEDVPVRLAVVVVDGQCFHVDRALEGLNALELVGISTSEANESSEAKS
ncbi:hypothetical protein E2C01_066861 [Portunus trituberculatus]|uniref:Uncharacterized protein n=1 Tax=Portunus trituberculatus TaxID=210409 RepID=A0A5B7HV04_PORTR|nr:hypothetical protein [Portunus trituberculatus]